MSVLHSCVRKTERQGMKERDTEGNRKRDLKFWLEFQPFLPYRRKYLESIA